MHDKILLSTANYDSELWNCTLGAQFVHGH